MAKEQETEDTGLKKMHKWGYSSATCTVSLSEMRHEQSLPWIRKMIQFLPVPTSFSFISYKMGILKLTSHCSGKNEMCFI